MKGKWIFVSDAKGVLSVLAASVFVAYGGNAVSSTPFIELSKVSVPEMPAKAAALVQAATASNRVETVRDVLRAVTVIARPGVLPYVVSAICNSSPDVAGATVGTATGFQPGKAPIFCRAAVCAAPNQVEEIVFSACRAAPADCLGVALTAWRVLPSASDSILAGLGRARPELELYLEEAQIKVGTNDVQIILIHAVKSFNDAQKAQE